MNNNSAFNSNLNYLHILKLHVAKHSRASESTLKKLIKDSSGRYKEAALENLKSRINIAYMFKEMELD